LVTLLYFILIMFDLTFIKKNLVVCMHITSFNIFVFLMFYLFEYCNCSVNNYNFFAMLEIVLFIYV